MACSHQSVTRSPQPTHLGTAVSSGTQTRRVLPQCPQAGQLALQAAQPAPRRQGDQGRPCAPAPHARPRALCCCPPRPQPSPSAAAPAGRKKAAGCYGLPLQHQQQRGGRVDLPLSEQQDRRRLPGSTGAAVRRGSPPPRCLRCPLRAVRQRARHPAPQPWAAARQPALPGRPGGPRGAPRTPAKWVDRGCQGAVGGRWRAVRLPTHARQAWFNLDIARGSTQPSRRSPPERTPRSLCAALCCRRPRSTARTRLCRCRRRAATKLPRCAGAGCPAAAAFAAASCSSRRCRRQAQYSSNCSRCPASAALLHHTAAYGGAPG